jgi:hypothetical protein
VIAGRWNWWPGTSVQSVRPERRGPRVARHRPARPVIQPRV